MLKRQLFNSLLQYLSIFPVVVLIGPRNGGKTVLAQNAVKWFHRQSLYLDLEFGPDLFKLRNADTFLKEYDHHCVILDEIQGMPGLLETIGKQLENEMGNGRFMIITSRGTSLLKQKAGLLSGKIGYLTLYPFNRMEVVEESDIENIKDVHWVRGGFPESFLAESEKESFVWRDNLIRTFCERDLPQMGFAADPFVIRTFLSMIATGNGKIWNASTYARAMGLSSPTVKKYLVFLEEAFLVNVLDAFVPESAKRLVRAPKIYISDSGLLHTLLQIEDENELRSHLGIGSSWEGYVITQIQSLLTRKANLFHYRTHQGAQIDLVIVRNGRPQVSIEIQTTNKPQLSKGFKIAVNDLKTHLNFILTPSSAHYTIAHEIEVINLDDALEALREKYFHQ